ncbi:hypothetical protein DYH09_19185 [bacterium CPR1]|nr:hypothetical protein [bacterium CPR1]
MSGERTSPAATNYVELCSLLFLAGVLVAVILPGWTAVSASKKLVSDLEGCRQNLVLISKALEDYQAKNKGSLPPRLSVLTEGKKPSLTNLPVCPASGKLTYEQPHGYQFKQGSVPVFTLRCAGTYHSEAGLKKDEPYYRSLYGKVEDSKSR